MNENLIRVGMAIASAIFSAGVTWGLTRGRIERLLKDFNGLGRKVSEMEKREARRYHNVSLCVLIASPEDKETQMSALLKEE